MVINNIITTFSDSNGSIEKTIENAEHVNIT